MYRLTNFKLTELGTWTLIYYEDCSLVNANFDTEQHWLSVKQRFNDKGLCFGIQCVLNTVG